MSIVWCLKRVTVVLTGEFLVSHTVGGTREKVLIVLYGKDEVMCSSTKGVTRFRLVDEIMTWDVCRVVRYGPEEFSIRFINKGGKTRKVPRQISTTSHPSNEALETLAITFICKSIPCRRGIKNGSNSGGSSNEVELIGLEAVRS